MTSRYHSGLLVGVLAVLVLSAHSLLPRVPVLTVICGASLLLVTIVLALRDPGAAGRRLAGHVVDGLPTMGDTTTSRKMISGRERAALHRRAVRELPSGVPVNVLLYPMEGDADASILYWTLAYSTNGSFMSVSRDWP